ncbi:MAG: hypothetical protein ABSA59_00980 [Terriglobia bacterium]|jgi:hypothetical protein
MSSSEAQSLDQSPTSITDAFGGGAELVPTTSAAGLTDLYGERLLPAGYAFAVKGRTRSHD